MMTSRQIRRSELRKAARAAWELEWERLAAWDSLRCLPGIALALGAGLLAGSPAAGAVASGGALCVGFGSFQRLRRSRTAPMLLATVGTAFSGFVGSLAGHSGLGFTLVSGLWAFGCGWLAALGTGAWWIGLQCVVFALIASSYPVGIVPTLGRVGLVLAGALLQFGLILIFWRVERRWKRSAPEEAEEEADAPLAEVIRSSARTLRENVSPRTGIGREALRLSLTVAVAAALSRIHWLGESGIAAHIGGYWMPMTALVVLKNDLHQTFRTSLARVAGTLAGALIATLVVFLLHPGPSALAALVVLFAWLCYSLLYVNYAVFAVCITAFIVFQLALVGLPPLPVVEARAVYTVLGGGLAMLAHLLWPGPGPEEGGGEEEKPGTEN